MTFPTFAALWANYPTGSSDEVKALIGGNVGMAWVTNTCVIRVCRALNYSGYTITDGGGLHTARGGDGLRYAYRVSEFKEWMEDKLGKPSSSYAGNKGIILFNVSTWSDATGHFDLWDGSASRHKSYFAEADSVKLWRVD